MAAEDTWKEINAYQLLLEATENVFSDQTKVVQNLLKSSRDLFSQEVLDQSLLSCCRNGILILLPDIISAGANLEVTDENGNTPLLVCALNSHKDCARCLMGAGANVNAVNFEGDTPLIVSALNSASIGLTKLLVSSKDVKIDHANNNGYTALLCAVKAANLNAIKLLIDADAGSEINEVSHDTCLNLEDIASRKGVLKLVNLFKLQKVTGKSPLLHAALNRNLEAAQVMARMDDSIINTTNDTFTSIMIQFLKSIQDNNDIVNQPELEMLDFLLTHVTANSQSSSEKKTIMDIAISIGGHAIVERLCKFDFVISHQNLSSAVPRPDFLRLLLTKSHIINKLNIDNQPVYDDSPLQKAMLKVEIDSAKALIQHGAFIDIDQALEVAVKNKQEKALELILSEFPDELGQKLKTPQLLHYAIINSALNIIPFLLDCGVDVNAEYNGKYSLTEVVDVSVLDLLLSRGADANVKIGSRRHTHPLHVFLTREFKKTLKNKLRSLQASDLTNTFLKRKIMDFVKCLLQHGALVDLQDGWGRTPLHIAACKFQSVRFLKLLIYSGADVNKTDDAGETPLWKAVVYEEDENVTFLIDAGADVNFVCKSTGQSLIFQATGDFFLEILLDNGADIKSIDGQSLLNSLLAKNHFFRPENVKRLIDAGCDVNHKNNDGYTVLILAARHVDIKLLQLLVQEGADVNASVGTFPYVTAITAMLSKLWYLAVFATPCINYLMDQNSNIDKVHSSVIHVFISSGCFSLIPRFISRGLAPAYLSMEESYPWFTCKKRISPLMMALFLNQSDLARYFIHIKYLMKSDISVLSGNRDDQMILEVEYILNSVDCLKTVSQQPFSLETLCFVVISDTLGATQDRRSKVQKLGLPQLLQDLLLFKNVTENDIKDMGTKNLSLFKRSLEQLNFNDFIDDDEDDDSIDLSTEDEH